MNNSLVCALFSLSNGFRSNPARPADKSIMGLYTDLPKDLKEVDVIVAGGKSPYEKSLNQPALLKHESL